MDLQQLGWDPEWDQVFAASRAEGLLPGRVALEDKHAFTLVGADGEQVARVAGRLMQNRSATEVLPKVGDWVGFSLRPGDTRAVIQRVLPRRTSLTRKVPGRENAPQILATNIDVAFVVQALDSTFNLRRLERFLVMVHEGGAKAIVVLNKADVADNPEARLAEAQAVVGETPVFVVSAHQGKGIQKLRNFLRPGRTAVFVGTSGVGKSSLINRLHGEEIQPTLEVRENDSKGRHSTTWRELILLPKGGLVIDTPGMREFHMWMADAGLDDAFPDIAELALRCHFRACSHTTEARCAIREALANGTLAPARFESYQKLDRELSYLSEERREHTYILRRRAGRARRAPDDSDRLPG